MGKEAEAKRLRRVANGQEKATYQVHITDRESWALVSHLLFSTTQKDHASTERLSRCIEEFELGDHYEMVTLRMGVPTQPPLRATDFDAEQFEVVSPARDTVDFVLEMTNREMQTAHAIALAPLIRRLKQAQAGTYRPPSATEENGSGERAPDAAPVTQ